MFAPDALAPLGGYPGDEDKARRTFATLEQPKTREDMLAAFRFLKAHAGCTGEVGAVGFCYGGGHRQGAAARASGREGRADQRGVARLRGRTEGRQRDVHGAHLTGAQHGFNNDTTPRFDAASATLAWTRTLEFFATHMRG